MLVVFDMEDVTELPTVVDPWFLPFGAIVTLAPILNSDDFGNAGPPLSAVVQKYG